ncbi:Putative lipid phosphate phosphatase 3, chloroplastic, partial [Linum perenne]
QSFPSLGSFSGLGFLSLYLSGKLKAFDCKGHIAKLCVIFLPLLIACLVGISRVDDYWHHWQDVFAGGVLGLIVSTFCYLQFFPPPYHPQGWGPYAYFRVLEEAQKIAEAPAAVNLCNVADNHNVAGNEQEEEKGFMGLQLEGDLSSRTTRDEECSKKKYKTAATTSEPIKS